jgi:hypothetical protein
MFASLDQDLHFGYQKNGSLVLAKNQEDMNHLHELKKRGEYIDPFHTTLICSTLPHMDI